MRTNSRKLKEGNDMLKELMKQHQPLLDHLAQRSKDDRKRQKGTAEEYLKAMRIDEEAEMDLSDSQGESVDQDE